jgi:hypothetical protein
MAKERYFWFRFSPGDYVGIREKLNELAAQGWMLAEEQDGSCYVARFCPTTRTELYYDTEPSEPLRQQEDVQRRVQARQAAGWENVATLNGVDIYRSLPLRYPKREAVDDGDKRLTYKQHLLRRWALSTSLMLVLAVLTVGSLLYSGNEWYLSNLQLFLRLTCIPGGLGVLYTLLWRGKILFAKTPKAASKAGLYLRSVLGVLGTLWLALGGVALALELVAWPSALLVMLCWAVAMISATGLWQRKDSFLHRQAEALITGVAALSLAGLTMVAPAAPTASLFHAAERQDYSGSVVYGEDLGIEGTLLSADWARQGSALVTYTSYSEWWDVDGETITVSTQCYQCRFGTAAWLEEQLTRQTKGGTVYRQGNWVLVVRSSSDLPEALLQQAASGAVERSLGG